jgi:hypothetical protein
VDDIAHETNEDFQIEEIVPTVKHRGRQLEEAETSARLSSFIGIFL